MLELSILCWVHKKSDGCTKQLPLVLYVSFGSVCALTQQHINELASDVDVKNDDPLEFLPHGFLERTKEQGLVITSWAPQTQILSHTSTGGCVTHCGWNSIVESIVAVVPMITWPLCAKQRMNDALVTEGLKVGLRPKFRETDGIVEKEEIARVVKDLMLGDEGKGIHQRIGKLKDAAADALKEHGSSTRALSQFGTELEN
ncbi:UDP-glycosyltransferase 72B1 [Glycine soja]|uniref:UDP-glycosyltransferase 72B1 n=1 Tax=Glycine soja TaxID=3848 RepID=A0A0B2RA68_GLYSO|nr:UDP-glycosyltransferase 72B1 [Glycine soja]